MGLARGWWPVRPGFVLLVGLVASLLSGLEAADAPKVGDDATYRPTVMVRRGKGLGTGTIIASVEGETLVLTASHVVDESGPVTIELFRFNVGAERVQAATGFPRRIEASVIARDTDADLAILRIRGQLAFPYVAKVAKGEALPPTRSTVTTIGFDKGAKLIGFSTRLRSVERVDLNQGGGARPFLVTDDPPEVGRSGGGLFRPDGPWWGSAWAAWNWSRGRSSDCSRARERQGADPGRRGNRGLDGPDERQVEVAGPMNSSPDRDIPARKLL